MTTHNLRVLKEANSAIDCLIQKNILLPTDEHISGLTGQVYRIADQAEISIVDHFNLRIEEKVIPVNVYALPPEEYAGLITASPEFTQYPYARLATSLLNPMTAEQRCQWLRDVDDAIEVGPRVDQTPRLLQYPTHPARWQPEKTRLSRAGCGWLLTLSFDDPRVDIVRGLSRSAAGIDIGLCSLATTAFASGAVHRAPGVVDIAAGCGDLPVHSISQRGIERHLHLLQHAAARTAYQHQMIILLSSASVVYIEDLTYNDMTDRFKAASRTLGIRDWMMAWLPQRLHAHGIHLERIEPDFTSQYCSVTHCRGARNGRDFVDGNGRTVDADLNAARNLLQLGLAKRIQKEKNQKNLKKPGN